MAASRDKYKRLEQLYVVGKEVVFKGTPMWVQVMNPLQADEARLDASTARARMMLALRELGSDEEAKAEAVYHQTPKAEAINGMLNFKWQEWFTKCNTRLRDDPEWTERVTVMERTDSDEMNRRAPNDPERLYYEQITKEFIDQVQENIGLEQNWERGRLEGLPPDELREEYLELYRETRANTAASLEFKVAEAWYSARVCEGLEVEPGMWDHSKCANHVEQVWESKNDYRMAPTELKEGVQAALSQLAMTVREAKNLGSTTSSSASSVLQSEPVESTPSTPTEIPDSAPGISTLQSSTA